MVSRNFEVEIVCRLSGLDLDVAFSTSSGITVLAGPSGSGKSTVLNCVAGLRFPDKGRIVCRGKTFFDSAGGINLSPQKRKCAYVLQSLALFPHMNVADNICFGIDKIPVQKRRERLRELLDLVKLNGVEKRSIAQLSGGQLQRVALARALAPHPDLLLLDEPFSALDAELREELGQELKNLQMELNVPVLLVTHSKSEAMQMAETAVLIEQGKVKSIGPARDLGSAGITQFSPSTKYSW